MRYSPDLNAILISDLTNEGQNIIVDKYNKRPTSEYLINRDQVHEQVLYIAERAYNNGDEIFLNFDAYCIVITSNNRGKVYLLDIGCRTHIIEQGHAYGSLLEKRITFEKQLRQANDFIDRVLYS